MTFGLGHGRKKAAGISFEVRRSKKKTARLTASSKRFDALLELDRSSSWTGVRCEPLVGRGDASFSMTAGC